MMAFPSMLEKASKEAGIKTPDDFDKEIIEYKDDYPHFFTLCILQLCKPMEHGSHFENAKVVAKFNEENLKEATVGHFLLAGFSLKNADIHMLPEEIISEAKADLEKWGIEPIE